MRGPTTSDHSAPHLETTPELPHAAKFPVFPRETMSEATGPLSPTVITTTRTRAGTLPSRFPSNASRDGTARGHTRNRSVPRELDQIRAYVEATNEHIHHIEDIVEPSATEQIVEIKRGLREAHRGLEQLQLQFAEVSEITRDVWQTYRRLRDLEEGLRGGIGTASSRNSATNLVIPEISGREVDTPQQPRVVRIEPAVETESVVAEEDAAALGVVKEEDEEDEVEGNELAERMLVADENWAQIRSGKRMSDMNTVEEGGEEEEEEEGYFPASRTTPTHPGLVEEWNDPDFETPKRAPVAGPSRGDGKLMEGLVLPKRLLSTGSSKSAGRPMEGFVPPRRWPSTGSSRSARRTEGLVPPKRLPSTASRTTQRTASGKHRQVEVDDSTKRKRDSNVEDSAATKRWSNFEAKPMKGSISRNRGKTRQEVIASVAEEEGRAGIGIIDPNRRREGSRDGWQITQAVMTADSDPTICVPHLAYMKIHEVRDLKNWLHAHKYLRQSKRISKTEKLLHLLTVLQLGCRYESVAVLFSRTPKEVLFSCREVFEGLLELHSETMLPPINLLERYLYPHLWHIVDKYALLYDDANEQHYHPWEKEDICKVLVTLNMYIGRYRSQGQVALEGEFLDWGRYVQVDPNEASEDVPGWVERLQTPIPGAGTRQEAISEAEEASERRQQAQQEQQQDGQAGHFHTQRQGSRSPRRGGLMESTVRLVHGGD